MSIYHINNIKIKHKFINHIQNFQEWGLSGAGNQSTCPREGKGRRTIDPLTILNFSASARLPVAQHSALSGGNTHMQGWGLTTCYKPLPFTYARWLPFSSLEDGFLHTWTGIDYLIHRCSNFGSFVLEFSFFCCMLGPTIPSLLGWLSGNVDLYPTLTGSLSAGLPHHLRLKWCRWQADPRFCIGFMQHFHSKAIFLFRYLSNMLFPG